MLIPVSQLALAMVVVREQHRSVNPINMINATIDVVMSPKSIDVIKNREQLNAFSKPYDEYYVDNPILARFVNTKFHDNALYFESKITERGQQELIDTTTELFWSIFPDPVLKYFEVRIAKKQLRFSMGDYLYYQATGTALGGYRYGSIFAHGMGMYGMFFPIIYFAICLLSYWILEFLSNKTRNGAIRITVVGVLLVWRLFFYGITSESVNNTIGFLFREIPQSILMFIVIYQISRLISLPFLLVEKFDRRKKLPGVGG
jgi:hypothetical protein